LPMRSFLIPGSSMEVCGEVCICKSDRPTFAAERPVKTMSCPSSSVRVEGITRRDVSAIAELN
jgi:hypothetical protein